jgi:putative ATP-binding cassette transporter
LFRTLAGIWPFAKGQLARPQDAMFIPQHPYFPNGPLRDALAYPQSPGVYSNEELKQALTHAMLPQLADRLDEANAWSQKLSGGEQQRLALARVFLKRPAWVFADEATSALDEEAEKTLYERLLALVKSGNGALISIAHRKTVLAWHSRSWTLEKQADGETAQFRLRQT